MRVVVAEDVGAAVCEEVAGDETARRKADEIDALVAGAAQPLDERLELARAVNDAEPPVVIGQVEALPTSRPADALEEADEAAVDVVRDETRDEREVLKQSVQLARAAAPPREVEIARRVPNTPEPRSQQARD